MDTNKLHHNLVRLCPPDHNDRKSIRVLAERLGLSAWAVYKWVNAGNVPPARIPGLLQLQREHFGEVVVPARDLNELFREQG